MTYTVSSGTLNPTQLNSFRNLTFKNVVITAHCYYCFLALGVIGDAINTIIVE